VLESEEAEVDLQHGLVVFVLNQNYWCNAPPRSAHAVSRVWRAWTKNEQLHPSKK